MSDLCRTCGVTLVVPENWFADYARTGYLLCKPCKNERRRVLYAQAKAQKSDAYKRKLEACRTHSRENRDYHREMCAEHYRRNAEAISAARRVKYAARKAARKAEVEHAIPTVGGDND